MPEQPPGFGRFRLLPNVVDHRQHVEQDVRVIATAMAKHVERGAEQLGKCHRLEDQTQSAIAVIGVQAFLPCRTKRVRPFPMWSRHVMAVNGSLIAGDMARTAISTSWLTAVSTSCVGVR